MEFWRSTARGQAKLEGMPWKENLPMEQRVELIREWKEGENITALVEAYGVSRKTVYQWIARQ